MLGYRFSKYTPQSGETSFDQLFSLFKELLVYTSGEVHEALDWMNQLDREYNLTTDEYGMGDFIEDLKRLGYLQEDEEKEGGLAITAKTEKTIRKDSLDQIFGKLKKTKQGNHKTNITGKGDESSSDTREFRFGDTLEQISMTQSLKNAQVNHGTDDFLMTEGDLEVVEQELKAQTSTVLMIDISHSMILYGEDRITPAKKVAMALAELITTRYPKDTLDIIVFGNDAWKVEIKDLPYLTVGPYHTNTVAGLELAMDILRRRKNQNKQIFMITDGKPTCLKEPGGYYQNSFGLDRKIVNKTLNMAAQCRRLKIPITTFMIARDPYLQQFVEEFTRVNNGRAFYTSLKGLGNYIFEDFERNRRKTVR
ncbi:MAG TPA: VWA domain-containing protein [Bacteroidia bacterium]|nr:VWA domain-containing protein [Bacteroidia bacterium]